MSFSIKGLFWQEDASQTPESKAAPVQEQKAAQPASFELSKPASAPSSGKPDDSIAKSLADALEQANIPGFDYLEFAKLIEALKASLPAEQLQYTTAFASTTAIDKTVTVEKLIETASKYLAVLQGKENEFNTFVQQKIDASITSKEKEVLDLQAQIEAKAKSIQTMSEEINKLTTAKLEITNLISENKSKIEQVHTNYHATLDLFISKINSDIEKIKKYLVK